MGWGFKRGGRGRDEELWGVGGFGDLWMNRESRVVVIVAFFAGRRWKVLEVCKPFNPSF